MRAALESNFISKHLAIYLRVMAGDLQSALCAGWVIGEQRAVEYRVARDRERRIVSPDIEQDVRNRQPAGKRNF